MASNAARTAARASGVSDRPTGISKKRNTVPFFGGASPCGGPVITSAASTGAGLAAVAQRLVRVARVLVATASSNDDGAALIVVPGDDASDGVHGVVLLIILIEPRRSPAWD